MEPPHDEVEFLFDVPPDVEAGAYANMIIATHTAHEFTLTFGIAAAPRPSDEDDAGSPLVVRCIGTARVHVPVTVLFDVIRSLNQTLTRYEAQWGEIEPPRRQREEEP